MKNRKPPSPPAIVATDDPDRGERTSPWTARRLLAAALGAGSTPRRLTLGGVA